MNHPVMRSLLLACVSVPLLWNTRKIFSPDLIGPGFHDENVDAFALGTAVLDGPPSSLTEEKINATVEESSAVNHRDDNTSTVDLVSSSFANENTTIPNGTPIVESLPPSVPEAEKKANVIIVGEDKGMDNSTQLGLVDPHDEPLGPLDCINGSLCCAPWEIDTDEWWGQHPDWEASVENDTHTCFRQIPKNTTKSIFLRQLHHMQWHGNCSAVWARPMVNSGYSASMVFLWRGLVGAHTHNRPFQVSRRVQNFRWRYAALGTNVSVCNTTDIFCYFLPLGGCTAAIKQKDGGDHEFSASPGTQKKWMWQYLTREQHWLRRRVYNFLRDLEPRVRVPCTAIHVRRTDALLEQNWRKKRHYFPIADYLKHTKDKNILLLTDDQSAIDEAHELFPDRKWLYVQRKRHRGTEGGMNAHIPSGDPAMEVVYILAELRLASHCKKLVHTRSGMVQLFGMAMDDSDDEGNEKKARRIKIDFSRQPNSTHFQSEEEFFEQVDKQRQSLNQSKQQ